MDPLVVVALITGGYGIIGALLKIIEKYFPGRSTPPPPPASRPTENELDRGQRFDERIDKYLDRLENDAAKERQHHEEELARVRHEYDGKIAELRSDYERLQIMYREAIERLESQSVAEKHSEPEAHE